MAHTFLKDDVTGAVSSTSWAVKEAIRVPFKIADKDTFDRSNIKLPSPNLNWDLHIGSTTEESEVGYVWAEAFPVLVGCGIRAA